MKGRFRLVSYEEGSDVVSRDAPNVRLVCMTDSGEKLVIWGTEAKNTKNIEKIQRTGLPCEIECDYREPSEDFKIKHNHKYWVPEDAKLTII